MATEMMEYRPGKWVKVIDGKIVGRATAKEVAAWQASRGETDVPAAPLTLEVDLDLPASSSAIDPGHSLDVPLRPAFSRRGRQVERSRPTRAGKPEPRPARKPDDAIDKDMAVETAIAAGRVRRAGKPRPARKPGDATDMEMTVEAAVSREKARPSAPAAETSGPPGDAIDKDMTVEMAMAKERAAQRRSASARPKPQDAEGPVMVRRRLPKAEAAPAEKPQDESPTKDTPLPKQSKPPAKAAKRKAPRRRKKTSAAAPARKKVKETAAAQAPAAEPEVEQPQEVAGPAASQGPSYWWIYNANRRPVAAFLGEWMPKYEAKFGHKATIVLCHEDDLAEVEATGVEAEVSELLQPGHFYLGHEDGGEPEAGRKKR
jgi:hypothetical protein